MADWYEIGEKVMRSARKARGLSVEAVARQLHVSSKTYDRHEKAGHVPRHRIREYAEVLGIEISEPDRAKVELEAEEDDKLDLILGELRQLRAERARDQRREELRERRIARLEAAARAEQRPVPKRRAQGGSG